MTRCLERFLLCALMVIASLSRCSAQAVGTAAQTVFMPQYSVTIEPGDPPQLKLAHDQQIVFQMPLIAGLASTTSEEHLSDMTYSLRPAPDHAYELTVSAKSSLWSKRQFRWRFFTDHIEVQQFASG